MLESVNSSSIGKYSNVSFGDNTEEVKESVEVKSSKDVNSLERAPKKDEVSISKKELTDAERKQVIYKSQTHAAGWSILFGLGSTLYYGLRSDEKIASQNNLDAKKDASLIDEIRKNQVIATVPSIFGVGILGWLGFKVLAKPKVAPEIKE